MNEHDEGRLRAYLDNELPPVEMPVVAAHLEQCAECAATLSALQDQADRVTLGLDALDALGATSDPKRALARFRAQNVRTGPRHTWKESLSRSYDMIRRSSYGPRWRPLGVAVTAVLCLAILFSIAPVREAAADFLGLFRIRKFAVIPLDQQQVDRLESLARQAEAAFGEPQIVREEGAEQAVTDAGQASMLAGYAVRTPSRLPDTAALGQFTVQAGPAMHFEFSRDAVAALLQAAGASPDGLPQSEFIAFDVDVGNIVHQQYQLGGNRVDRAFDNRLELIQAPSPQVELPAGVDPVALAKTGFLLLGLPAEDAERMANSIDWTSTLVIPLPTNAAKAREVSVDGVTGLLLEGMDAGRQSNALLWERDDILYLLSGTNLDERTLLDAADSLQ